MNWLIRRRAHLSGELIRLEQKELVRNAMDKAYVADLIQKLAEARKMIKTHAGVHAELRRPLLEKRAAIDLVLGQHEIKIDPNSIAPVKTRAKASIAKHGRMTKDAYAYLSRAKGVPCTGTQVASYIAHSYGIEYDTAEFADLRKRVQQSLRHLGKKRRAKNVSGARGKREGLWILVPDAPP
ncbi:hypothetical protein [Rhodoferax lacus]|nr:hypothetical protein [Rhodoferax lacus]